MTLTKRKQAALQTRENIIKAAASLMEENKIDDIMVEDITNAAGVSKGTFYTYFKKKEDIVDVVGAGSFDKIMAAIRQMDDPIETKTRYYFNHYLRNFKNVGQHLTRDYLINELHKDAHELTAYKQLTEIFDHATKSGELKADAPIEDLVTYILSLLDGMCYLWCTGQNIDVSDQILAFYNASIDHFVRRYKN